MGNNAWLFRTLASAGFASLTAVFVKMGLQGIDSNFAVPTRTLVILAALALFLTHTGKWQGMNGSIGGSWTFLILSGLATGVSWLVYFKALQLGNVSQIAPVDKFSLVLVALMTVVFLDERPSTQEWVGLGLVTTGVLTLALKRQGEMIKVA